MRINTLLKKLRYHPSQAKAANMKVALDSIEFLVVLLSIPLSYHITQFLLASFDYNWRLSIPQMVFFSVLIMISWFVLSQVTSAASLPRAKRYATLLLYHLKVHLVVLVILLLIKYVFYFNTVPVLFVLIIVPVSMVITFMVKMLATHRLRVYRAKGYNLRYVMVIADSGSTGLLDKLSNQKDWGFKISSIVSESQQIKDKFGKGVDILTNPDLAEIQDYLDNNIIDEVIYTKKQIDSEEMSQIADICKEVGVIFRYQSSAVSTTVQSSNLQLSTYNSHTKNQQMLVDVPSNNLPLMIKNMADMYLTITAVIILVPVFLVIAIIIKMESKGPVFFKQERLGLRGRKFKLVKFRTMVVNAEELLESLRKNNEMDGPTFKMKHDPRITRFGRFLRKSGLDELPQFFNVISGEMSLIGPRPPLETEVKQYERWQLRRLSVKPGITCTWQITPNRNDVKFEKWMRLDLQYIDNWSLAKDAELFFKTISSMFLASGR